MCFEVFLKIGTNGAKLFDSKMSKQIIMAIVNVIVGVDAWPFLRGSTATTSTQNPNSPRHVERIWHVRPAATSDLTRLLLLSISRLMQNISSVKKSAWWLLRLRKLELVYIHNNTL